MKAFKTVMKVFVALAAVAGVIYVVAAYGEEIVAWAKRVLGYSRVNRCDLEEDFLDTEVSPEAEQAAAEQAPETVPADENAVVADDADFEG